MALPAEGTLLVLSVGGVPLYSARDLEQTLEPINAAANTRRTINGALVDLSVNVFQKLKSSISGTDIEAPAFDGFRPGLALTVDCVAELVRQTGQPPSRTVVGGSERVVGGFTIYRPRLAMMVINLNQRLRESDHEVQWELNLEEV